MKKIISILLTITMLLGVTATVPLSVSAATTDKVESGYYNPYEDYYPYTEMEYTNEYGTWLYILTSDGNGCIITDYDESMTDIEIPSSINGLPVVEIGYSAFSVCRLTSITIPDSVTTIGIKAFSDCFNLTSITIPNSVTTIREFAFFNCPSLTSITISDGVTTIGEHAFEECHALTNVTIPDSVTYIADRAFAYCKSLTNIDVSSNNKNYSSIDGVLFDKKQSELITYPIWKLSNSYNVPNSVITIGTHAFAAGNNLTSVTIPDSVTNIEDRAFYSCSNLTSITISDSVTTIGSDAFFGCKNLSDVYYTGSKSEWNSIEIGSCYNNPLEKATIHYNYVPIIAGDLSGDGTIAVDDVIYVLKYVVGNVKELTDEQIANADLNGDGELTVIDAILVQKLILEMV